MGIFTLLSTFFVTPPSKEIYRIMEVPGIKPGSSRLLHCHLFIVIAKLARRLIGFNLSLAMALQLGAVYYNVVCLTSFML